MAAGAYPNLAFQKVYAQRSLESFKLQVESFNTLTTWLDGKGCYIYVTQEMLKSTGTVMEDTEGFIDAVRTLQGFSIVIFFKEVGDKDIRVSTRALAPIQASKLMGIFGGGGHPRASGCRILLPLKEATEHFVEVAEKAIKSGEVLEDGPAGQPW